MKRALIVALLGLASVLAGFWLAPAWAQDSGTSSGSLQIEAERKRTIVHPRPPLAPAIEDAERAAAELERQRRERELTRQLMRPQPRRPDLDYDVRSGIQGQNLQRALPR
jgi:hypothetical protein